MDLTVPKVTEAKTSLEEFDAALQVVTKDEAIDALRTIVQQESEDWFRVGMVLSAYNQVNNDEAFKDLAKYAEQHFNINIRTAYYLKAIYEKLVDSKIKPSQVAQIGWTKLKEIIKLIDADNVDYWLDIAKNNTTKQLIALIKSSATANSKKSAALDAALDEPTVAIEKADTFVSEVDPVLQYDAIAPAEPFKSSEEVYEPKVSPIIEGEYTHVVAPAASMANEVLVDAVDTVLDTMEEVIPVPPTPVVVVDDTPIVSVESLVTKLAPYDLQLILKTIHDIYPHVTIEVVEKTDATITD